MRQTIVVAMLVAASCKSTASKTEKAGDELSSWAAAGQLLSMNWAEHRAETPYVKSTVKVASDEVEKLRQPLQSDSDSTKTLDQVSALYRKLSDAIEHDDRSSGGEIGRAFGSISSRLQRQKNASQS